MSTMNNVTLAGRVVRDAEMHEYAGKVISARFTLACRRDYKDKSGEYKTDFIECRIIGEKRAPQANMLKQGSRISVIGAITPDSYKKEGKTVYTTYVTVEAFGFLPGGGKAEHEEEVEEVEEEVDVKEEFVPITGKLPFI